MSAQVTFRVGGRHGPVSAVLRGLLRF